MTYQPANYKKQGGNEWVIGPGGLLTIEGQVVAPAAGSGSHYFVDSVNGDSGNAGTSWNAAKATIEQAMALVSANDIIHLAPGHTQSVGDATTFLIDTAGVTIIGYGVGDLRPTFTLASADAASCLVTADDVRLRNILFTNTRDGVTCAVHLNAADDCILEDIEIRDTGAVEADRYLRVQDSARVRISGLFIKGEGTGDQAFSAVSFDGSDDCILEDFILDTAGSAGIIETTEDDEPLNLTIRRGEIRQREAAVAVAIDSDADVTGTIGPDVHLYLTDNDTDLFGAIEAGGDWRLVGPVTVVNGAQEAGVDISQSWGNLAVHNLIQTPWGAGRMVTKSTTDHSAATVALFNVTGGKVLVLALTGEVTTALPAATDFDIHVDNGGATALALATTLVVDSDEAKTMYGITGKPADALQVCLGAAPWCSNPVEVDAVGGTTAIQLVVGDTGAASGVVVWNLVYVPLERGAAVAAA